MAVQTRGRRRSRLIALVPGVLEPLLQEWPGTRAEWQPYRWRDPARVPAELAPALDALQADADRWWAADQRPGVRVGR